MKKKTFYITTTLPYINAAPHIGFALEIVQADVLARFKRLMGYQVFFNTGTDEHGLKIYKKAIQRGSSPQEYCNLYAKKFTALKKALNLSYTNFIRTTNKKHIKAVRKFWQDCLKNGAIYKKNYHVKYCVGCEMEKTDSELINGRCPLHPNLKIETYEEENYFFRFSKYQDKLLRFYEKNKNFVIPQKKFHEIKNFVKKGLKDFSISRLKAKMPWGIEVPGDNSQVIYVWFDALINYISTLGWPENKKQFNTYWPGTQIAGADNLRQQTAIWQAMLMAAGIANSIQIYIHGFITANGQKMSKSLGNVISPFDLVKKYGSDAVRFYLLREIPSNSDGDFSLHRMEEIYSSELANELGNLTSRLTNLGEKDNLVINSFPSYQYPQEIANYLNNFQFDLAIKIIWEKIKQLNKEIDQFAPWKKEKKDRQSFLVSSLKLLHQIGWELQPFIPQSAAKIIKATQGEIHKTKPLFKRNAP